MTQAVAVAQGGTNNVTFRNRIINGSMVFDQRNAGASVSASTTGAFVYTLDRFAYVASQASKFTIQQNAGSVTLPAGFTNYLGATVGASANVTVGAGDYFSLNQIIEGFNVADLGWGTANAKTVTLSFQVYSSLTGTFGGVVSNNSAYSYPFTYTISSANTWTTISVTIAGPTSGTWGTGNGVGIRVIFDLGTGSSGRGTAGAWASTNYIGATGATNWISTNSATFYITGVQLEAGTTATPFEQRLYGTELALCQRYYEASFPYGTTVANYAGNNNSSNVRAMYVGSASGSMGWSHDWKVPKRASPIVTVYRAGSPYTAGQLDNAGTGVAATVSNIGTHSAFIYAAGNNMYFNFTVEAEL